MGIDLKRVLHRVGFLTLALLNVRVTHRHGAIDFDANVWLPAQAVLHGRTPYPPDDIAALIQPSFLHPPLLLAVDIPLSLLGHDPARVAFWLLGVASVVGALRIVGVEDWRVLGWGAMSFPVWNGLGLGSPTLLILPVLAAAWRLRANWWMVGVAVGVAGAFKLVVWPLGVWLLATRRYRSAALAAGVSVALVLVPWALIGFASFTDYPSLLDTFSSRSGAPRALTITVFLEGIGVAHGAAQAAQWIAGFAVLACVPLVARREQGGDEAAFALAILTVLVISPVVERVYLAMALVPLAIARPAFGRAWMALWLLWLTIPLPSGPRHAIVDDGRTLLSGGYVPSPSELVVVFVVLMVVAVATTTVREPGPETFA